MLYIKSCTRKECQISRPLTLLPGKFGHSLLCLKINQEKTIKHEQKETWTLKYDKYSTHKTKRRHFGFLLPSNAGSQKHRAEVPRTTSQPEHCVGAGQATSTVRDPSR